MRVLYDGQIYSMQAVGGVNRYFTNLIGRLPADFVPSLVIGPGRGASYPAHASLEVYRLGRMRLEHVSYRLSRLCSQFEDCLVKGSLARKRFDVFHPTYYTLLAGRGPRGSRRPPTVLTVWDMIHELFPAELDPRGLHAEQKRRAILGAQRIICISESTKKDLLERYPVVEGRVVVTHLASAIDAACSHGPESVPARPYYLYVGSRPGYKNFDLLLKAFAKAHSARPDLLLAVVGGPFTEAEEKRLAGLGLMEHVEHFGCADDRHLAKLYRCSRALVYPSLYEGFGIPVLEAMACGTVPVASNNSSLPEVTGGAGILFNPGVPDDLADILIHLLDDSAQRERLIAAGRRRAKEFSWDETVSRTVSVYRSLCD